jgi:hypothetical protein
MVSIQVPESTAVALTAQAHLQGLSLEEYLSRVARGGVAVTTSRMSVDDVERELDALALDVPVLPSDFSRADIYVDHD